MANARRETRDATRSFRKAWKLLGRLEREVVLAQEEEARRLRQVERLSKSSTIDAERLARRTTQLDAARARLAATEGLLTELSELIASNARARSGQVVANVAHEAALAVREAAASEAVRDAAAAEVIRRAPRVEDAGEAPDMQPGAAATSPAGGSLTKAPRSLDRGPAGTSDRRRPATGHPRSAAGG